MRKSQGGKEFALGMPEPEKVELAGVNFAVYNPRRITPEKMAQLKASLIEHGMVLNLVIQKRADDGTERVLVGGHQRVKAMREIYKERGLEPPKHVWATLLDIRDEQAKRLNIALNNIEADFDDFLLGSVLASIRDGLTPERIVAMGFEASDVDELVRQTLSPDEQADDLEGGIGDLSPLPQVPTLSISFGSAEDRDTAKAALKRLAAGGVAPGLAVKAGLEMFEAAGAPAAKRMRRAKAS